MSGHKQMPRYQSHKVVRALKLRRVDWENCALIPADDSYEPIPVARKWMDNRIQHADGGIPEEPGYFVLYEDGYMSWSPTEAFEAGYALIPDGASDSNAVFIEQLNKISAERDLLKTQLSGILERAHLIRDVTQGIIQPQKFG